MKTRNKIKNVSSIPSSPAANLNHVQFAMMDFQALKACFVPDGGDNNIIEDAK